MTTPLTDRDRLDATQNLLTHYARTVAAMMAVARDVHVHKYVEKADELTKLENEVYSLTTLHLLPPIPLPPEVPEVDWSGLPDVPVQGEQLSGPDIGLCLLGRGFSDPAYTVNVLSQRVVVRVDDKANKMSWIELGITEELIAKWNRDLCEQEEEEPGEAGQFDEV